MMKASAWPWADPGAAAALWLAPVFLNRRLFSYAGPSWPTDRLPVGQRIVPTLRGRTRLRADSRFWRGLFSPREDTTPNAATPWCRCSSIPCWAAGLFFWMKAAGAIRRVLSALRSPPVIAAWVNVQLLWATFDRRDWYAGAGPRLAPSGLRPAMLATGMHVFSWSG